MPGQGPLPDPDAIRRNAPTIPTTKLPAGGRRGPIPDPPEWIALAQAGRAWWAWAWRTPQAAAWDDGALVKVAHRASLEDDLAMQQRGEDLDDLLVGIRSAANAQEVKQIVVHLAALATGRLGILAKINDLDDRLGLSPKARDALRMKVIPDEDYYPANASAAKRPGAKVTRITDRRSRITGAP